MSDPRFSVLEMHDAYEIQDGQQIGGAAVLRLPKPRGTRAWETNADVEHATEAICEVMNAINAEVFSRPV